ncbi:hypothetical protein GCM10020216_109270 [Nonomuraea helvata]
MVAAVFSDHMDVYAVAVAVALDDPDPWHGFTGYIETDCVMQAADHGFADVLTLTFPTAETLEERRQRGVRGDGATHQLCQSFEAPARGPPLPYATPSTRPCSAPARRAPRNARAPRTSGDRVMVC